jgi:hypothetical protein
MLDAGKPLPPETVDKYPDKVRTLLRDHLAQDEETVSMLAELSYRRNTGVTAEELVERPSRFSREDLHDIEDTFHDLVDGGVR